MENTVPTCRGALPPGLQVLLIDSDVEARQTLARHLGLLGANAGAEAGDGEAALHLAARSHFDLAVAAVALPDMNGRELCSALRKRHFAAPIVLLSRTESDSDVVAGLESGANDVIIGPYSICVLVARLRAHLRRFVDSEDALLAIGSFLFEPARRRLTDVVGGRIIRLTAKETALLKYFYLHGDKKIDTPSLTREVWGHSSDIYSHTAQTHIYRLRQKIELDPADPQIIVSAPGGYRLGEGAKPTLCPITSIDAAARPASLR